MSKKLQLITAGIGIGQDLEGVEHGPSAWIDFFEDHYPNLLAIEPEKTLLKINLSPVHLRDNRDSKNFPFEVYDQLTERVATSQTQGHLPVVLGGDHSIAIGSVMGSLQTNPNTKVVWVDAHGDINTPETTPSGRVHGMPLAYLLGLWAQDRYRQRLHEKNLVLFGVRDLDSGEKKIIRDLSVKVISQSEISRRGVEKCWQDVHKYLALDTSPVHVSFDVDAMDPQLFPHTGVPVKRGLNVSDMSVLFQKLSEVKHLRALDIVEFNPLVEAENVYAIDGRHLLGNFLNNLASRLTIGSDVQSQLGRKNAPLKTNFRHTSAVENMPWPNLA